MSQRPTHFRYRALGWLTLACALAYLCRNAIGVAESSVRDDLHLTLNQSGWFMGAFFWSYALFQVPSGMFAQRFGTRISMTIFAIGWSIASLGIGIAPGFWMLIVAQLVMGISQAGLCPAACDSIGHWFPLSQRSMACGILTAGMQVGAISTSVLTGKLIDPIGWRWAFILYALPGIVWAIWFAISFRNRPEQEKRISSSELQLIQDQSVPNVTQKQSKPVRSNALPNRSGRFVIWFLCGQQICRAAGYMFFASWFPTFLQATRGFSIEASGLMQGLVLGGTLVGSLLGGIITDLIWRKTGSLRLSRSGTGTVALGICGLLVLGAWLVEDVTFAITLLTLGSLFAALAGPPMFAAVIDIGGNRVPQLMGLVNMCGNLATAACPILVGQLFEWTPNWNLVLILFAIIYLAGGVCWALVDPQKKISVVLNPS